MAEILIKLNPDDLDDRDKLELMQHGWKFRSCLFELDQYLRSRLKYEDLTSEVAENLQQARDRLWEIIEEHGVELE